MRITIKLFAYLREGRFKEKDMEFPDGTVVQEVLKRLSITREEMEIGILFINGKRAQFSSTLRDNDTLAIFPPAAGG